MCDAQKTTDQRQAEYCGDQQRGINMEDVMSNVRQQDRKLQHQSNQLELILKIQQNQSNQLQLILQHLSLRKNQGVNNSLKTLSVSF